MGINASVEMGKLGKSWVISCLSLPFQLGPYFLGRGLGKGNRKRLAVAQHSGLCDVKGARQLGMSQVRVLEQELQ